FLEWAAVSSPALQTPGALLFQRAGLRPPPAGVKEARATLRAPGLLPDGVRPLESRPLKGSDPSPALRLRGAWLEWPEGRTALRGLDLAVAPGGRGGLGGG